MSRKRKAIPLYKQLAAALCQLGAIPHEDAKRMSPQQVRALFDLHHYPIAHAWDGPDEHWNLEFRFKPDHREITAKQAPVLAKVRRAEKRRARSVTSELERPSRGRNVPARERKSAPIPGSKGTPWKRKLNGRTEARGSK